MDLATTYKIFVIKTLKEKRYFWAKNTFFVLFPLLFMTLYMFTGAAENTKYNPNDDSLTHRTINEVTFATLELHYQL